MKIIRLEATCDQYNNFQLNFNEKNGVTPEYPNTVDESKNDLAIGTVSENSKYFHHIDRADTRYLIYLKSDVGVLNGQEISNLEKALDNFLSN